MNVADSAAMHNLAVLGMADHSRNLNTASLTRRGAGDRSCFHSLGHWGFPELFQEPSFENEFNVTRCFSLIF